MILWTIVPIEEVFSSTDFTPQYEEMTYNGKNVQVEKAGSAQYKVVRLLSTDPKDYLCLELQPGSLLNYK